MSPLPNASTRSPCCRNGGTKQVDSASPPEAIVGYVEDQKVDFLVIATHGRTGLDRLLIGSVAERVVRQSPIPVFLVKPERASLLADREDADVAAS
ncbi:MAG: hypothetical protein BRD55_02170 [Bacteroidetes bacterium SW_9_63_38]|nr:MAG: hypothetical protein BRD55_02170 [Bacteroidetes bacterium SW_9_63_38]